MIRAETVALRRMIMFKRLLLLLILLHAAGALAEDSAAPSPDMLVKQVVDEVLSSIKQNREITHDQTKMNDLVEAKVFSHFDFSRLTRLTVGGKYWADATSQEQLQLIGEFHTFLTHVFSDVIAQYTDQTIFFIPFRMQPEAQDTTVKTVVLDRRDESMQLDYKLEKTDSGWLIYDVDIDNMSLIRIYHSNFSNELQNGGVSNLVSVLHKKNLEVESARHG
jgi:phospholipid transport system substrate-binding protein